MYTKWNAEVAFAQFRRAPQKVKNGIKKNVENEDRLKEIL